MSADLSTLLEVLASRIEAKLASSVFPNLTALWDAWDLGTIQDFHAALVAWHAGDTYMHTDEKEFSGQTPLDAFATSHPAEWQDYADIVSAGASKIQLFRTILFEQADRIVDKIIHDGDEYLLHELWGGLDWQNQLHFRTKPISNESLTDYNFEIVVRRFSSWTSKAYVAFKLSHAGGQEQIGPGAIIARASQIPRVVHTFDSAVAFDKWCQGNKASGCSPFMARWTWQLEYVVESDGPVSCDGLEIVSTEGGTDYGDGYYERIRDAAGMGEDEDEYV